MANAFTREAFSLLGIGVLFVTLRQISRVVTVGIKGLWLDDYLIVLATVVYALETGTAYIVGGWYHGLANNGISDEQRANLTPSSQEYHFRVNGSKTQLIGWSLYTLLLWLLKLCMCIFFQRLTQGIDHMLWRVKCAYILVVGTYIATICSVLLGCQPFHHNWQIYPDPGNQCQPAVSHIDLYVTVVLNVVSDMYLLSIPVALFWKASIPWTKRVSMIGLFSGGIFVMTAACLRCALIIADPIGGAQAAGSWAVRETFVAVIVTNLPIVYQGYRKTLHPTVMHSIKPRSDEETGYTNSSTKSRSRNSKTHSQSTPIDLPRLDLVQKNTSRNSWTSFPNPHGHQNEHDTQHTRPQQDEERSTSRTDNASTAEETTPAKFA